MILLDGSPRDIYPPDVHLFFREIVYDLFPID